MSGTATAATAASTAPAPRAPSGGWRGAVAVQMLGAAATFGVGLLISVAQGPLAQGRYGIVRALADLLMTLALFGLPQGIVHLVNRIGASPAVLARWGRRYVLAVAVLMASALATALALLGAAELSLLPTAAADAAPGVSASAPWALLWLLLGVTGWTAHGLQRSLVLCVGGAQRFAWVTVAPALSLLLAVAVAVGLGSQRYELAVAASGLASALAGVVALRPLRRLPRWVGGSAPQGRPLLVAGLQSFAQTLALALQTWLTLQLLRWHGVAVAEVGLFVFAAYVWQAFALPAGFVAPLWFAEVSAGGAVSLRARIGRVLRWTVAAALAVAALSPWAVPGLFGAAYAPAVGACLVLALGGPLLVLNRLGMAVLLGRGGFNGALVQALLRMAALPLLLWALLALAGSAAHAATLAALSWVGVEAVCALALLATLRTASGTPGREPRQQKRR